MDAFTNAYIEAALWSSNDNSDPNTGGDPLDANYSMENIASDSLHKMEADCVEFQRQNARLLDGFYDAGYKPDQAGHDFWLTRNGHGSGFWDENAPEDVIEGLTAASKEFGEQDFFVDRGMLHLEGGRQPGTQKPLFSSKASLLKKADPKETKILDLLRIRPMTTKEIEVAVSGGTGKYSVSSWPAVEALKNKGQIVQKQMRWHLVGSIARGYGITGARPNRQQNPADWHALNIALKTMNMPDEMIGVMGGPNKAQAEQTILRLTGKPYAALPESMKRRASATSLPATLRPKRAEKVEWRKYRCLNCGHEQPISTNHTGKVIDYCKECSWKPSWRANPENHKIKDDGLSVPFNGRTYRPFEFVGPWDFNADKESVSGVKPAMASAKTALSRKDYILLAEALQTAVGQGANIDIVKNTIADALQRDNPSFNKQHFLDVVKGGKNLTSRPSRSKAPSGSGWAEPPMNVNGSTKNADWNDDPQFAEWQHDVAEGNTRLGFEDWKLHMDEANSLNIEELPVQPPKRSLPNLSDIKLPHESSKKARFAGSKLAGVDPALIEQAKQLIEADDPLIYDVAADSGQIVGNVKHMSWFVREVAEWLASDAAIA